MGGLVTGKIAADTLVKLGGGLISSLFGGISNNKAQQQTNEMNWKIAQLNNNAQIKMAQENNALQQAMLRENNQFNRNMALEMFNLENEYNTPQAQMQRLMQAGLNPNVAMSSGGTTGNSSPTVPSASGSGIQTSMPSLTTPHMDTPPSILGAMFESFESITRSLGNLSKSGVDDATKEKIYKTMQAELDKLLAQKDNEEASAAYTKVLTDIQAATGKEKVQSEISKNYMSCYLDFLKGNTEQAEAKYKGLMAELAEKESKFKDEQYPLLLNQIEESIELVRRQQKTEDSKQSANYASAEASRASAADSRSHIKVNEAEADYKKAMTNFTNEQTSQLEDMHTDNVILKRMFARKMGLDAEFAAQTLNVRVQMLKNANAISEKEAEKLEQDIKLATKANNMYYINWIYNRIDNTMRDVGYVLPFGSSPVSVEKNSYGPSFSSPSSTY